MSNELVDHLACEYVVAHEVPAEAAYFAATIEKFLEESNDAVQVWEARSGGQPSLADEYSNVARASNILRSVSKDLDKVTRLLR